MPNLDQAADLLRQGQAAFRTGRLDLALSLCRRAIELAPSRADAHFNMAVCFETKGDNLQAISSYRRQPFYTSSIEKWISYEPWLREFSQLR